MPGDLITLEGEYDVDAEVAQWRITDRTSESRHIASVTHYRRVADEVFLRPEVHRGTGGRPWRTTTRPWMEKCWMKVDAALLSRLGIEAISPAEQLPGSLRVARDGTSPRQSRSDDSLHIQASAEVVFSTFGLRTDAFDDQPDEVLETRVPATALMTRSGQVMGIRANGADVVAALPGGELPGTLGELLPELRSTSTLTPLDEPLHIEPPGDDELLNSQGRLVPCAAASR